MKLSMTSAITASLVASSSAASLRSQEAGHRELSLTVPSDHLVSHTEKVMYSCSVSSSWSAVNHPVDYPSDAHTSSPVLVAHNSGYKMFTPGEAVSEGVKMVAETGKTDALVEEMLAAGDAVMSFIAGVPMFFGPKPGMEETNTTMVAETASDGGRRDLAEDSVKVSKGGDAIYDARSQTIVSNLIFTPDHTSFSSISMLAPSPDWFSGSHGQVATTAGDDGDVWLKSFKYETLPYDAGTDSGVTFKSEDLPTDPVGVASVFTVDSTDNGIFVNAAGDAVLPVYGWECTIAEVKYTCEFDPDCDDGEGDGEDSGEGDGDSTSGGSMVGFVSGLAGSVLAASYLLL